MCVVTCALWGWMLLFDKLENCVFFISILEIQNKLNTETRLNYCSRTELSFVSYWPETCSPNPYFPGTMMSPTLPLVRLSIWLCWFIVLDSLEWWLFYDRKNCCPLRCPSEGTISLGLDQHATEGCGVRVEAQWGRACCSKIDGSIFTLTFLNPSLFSVLCPLGKYHFLLKDTVKKSLYSYR